MKRIWFQIIPVGVLGFVSVAAVFLISFEMTQIVRHVL